MQAGAMRVEELYPQAVRSAESPGQAEKSADPDRARAEGLADTVSLSRLSLALLFSAPDKARLDQLRSLLASGAYQIQPVEVSRRIVDFYLDPWGEEVP